MFSIRTLTATEEAQLPRFLALAAHEADAQSALANPDLARYVEGFGRAGDCAVVAQSDGEIVGIAWARLWTLDNRGFGWMDAQTPEMAMAVAPNFRGRGIGAALVEALKRALRATGAGQIALNVRADSPAVRLYQRLGFEPIAGSERINRAGGQLFNMSAPLD